MIYYGSNDYRDYLAHYGVVGMHWGIRRYQPYSVKPRGSGKGGKFVGDGSSDRRAQLKAKKKDAYDAKKNVNLLSDEELSRRVKRFENERKLKQYTDETYAPKRTATKKAVSRVLTSLSNATLKTASKAAAAVIVPAAITAIQIAPIVFKHATHATIGSETNKNIGSTQKLSKNQKMLDTANRHADEQIKLAKEYIEYHDADKRVNEYKSKYGDGKTKESQEKWLTEMYGPDWKDASYMKSVWEVDDVHKHAREEIQTEINNISRLHNNLKNSYTEDLKNWQSFKSRINDISFEKLSKDDIKRIKQSVKKQAKWDKWDERNARNEKKNESFETDEKDEDD